MKCDWRREKLEYLYKKRFEWKIAEPIGRRVTGGGKLLKKKKINKRLHQDRKYILLLFFCLFKIKFETPSTSHFRITSKPQILP